ncbi:hypothetical protein CEXT_415961 [Caerostris extrusa]|uniref:Uncharacterized protein n=1 Tax=Caerostris extrusa TaxID=172846 RepID=A0AAV4SDU7_CAEEX|nr:hypothetical protein CEXT_415961 [Caerostris extrusa]
MKFMSDQILSLKKELADLQEFTTLEKQLMTEHALSPNDCMDANIDEKEEIKERSFSEVVNEKNADFPSEQALKK